MFDSMVSVHLGFSCVTHHLDQIYEDLALEELIHGNS